MPVHSQQSKKSFTFLVTGKTIKFFRRKSPGRIPLHFGVLPQTNSFIPRSNQGYHNPSLEKPPYYQMVNPIKSIEHRHFPLVFPFFPWFSHGFPMVGPLFPWVSYGFRRMACFQKGLQMKMLGGMKSRTEPHVLKGATCPPETLIVCVL